MGRGLVSLGLAEFSVLKLLKLILGSQPELSPHLKRLSCPVIGQVQGMHWAQGCES